MSWARYWSATAADRCLASSSRYAGRFASSFGTSGRVRPCQESASPNCDDIALTQPHFFSADASMSTTTLGSNGLGSMKLSE